MENLVLGLGDVAYPVICHPFRYSDAEQVGLMSLIQERHVTASQEGKYLDQIYRHASYTLRTEHGISAISKLKVLRAASLLPNLAWHEGRHVEGVVVLSATILQGVYEPLVYEYATQTTKNAVFTGDMQAKISAIRAIQEHSYYQLYRKSPRVADGGVRTFLYGSEFSELLPYLKIPEIKLFLQAAVGDQNIIIQDRAQEALNNIFN